MMNTTIHSKTGDAFTFRLLTAGDADRLGTFFENLDNATRARFGPHPLTKEHAAQLCEQANDPTVRRFIIEHATDIAGYFILDFNTYPHEVARYREQGITINADQDPVFAPCIAPKYQNCGIATQAMDCIISFARTSNIRSIVLMGGTQESNELARAFYRKCGFKECGRFYTEYNQENNVDMRLLP